MSDDKNVPKEAPEYEIDPDILFLAENSYFFASLSGVLEPRVVGQYKQAVWEYNAKFDQWKRSGARSGTKGGIEYEWMLNAKDRLRVAHEKALPVLVHWAKGRLEAYVAVICQMQNQWYDLSAARDRLLYDYTRNSLLAALHSFTVRLLIPVSFSLVAFLALVCVVGMCRWLCTNDRCGPPRSAAACD